MHTFTSSNTSTESTQISQTLTYHIQIDTHTLVNIQTHYYTNHNRQHTVQHEGIHTYSIQLPHRMKAWIIHVY